MALLKFDIVALNAGPTKTADALPPEFVEQYTDVLQWVTSNPGHAVRVDFGTHAEREAWFANAKAYGRSLMDNQDNPMPHNIRRIKNTDSMNTEHGIMTFLLEPSSAKDERQAEVKASAEFMKGLREWAQKTGKSVSAKGKIAQSVKEEYMEYLES